MNTDTRLAGEDRGVWELAAPDDGQTGGPAVRAAQDDGYLTETQAVDRLGELDDAIARREDAQRQIVTLLGELVRSGRIEQLEGLTPELLLKLKHAQSGLDCWLVLTAVEVLARMPATARLYRQGLLSWSQVCQIVSRVRRLPVEAMGIIDRRIDASTDLLDALGPDGLEAAVDQAVREAQGPERAEKDEARARTDGFVHLQPKLFGGIKLYGEYDDPVEAATIVNGLDAAAATARRHAHHDTDPHTDTGDRAGDGDREDGRGSPVVVVGTRTAGPVRPRTRRPRHLRRPR
ncbi:MAG: 13E12 repeat family protein [Actinobacteria bacterium]|nr:13E12 repeat family protein [Actinomycetota bacterium]